jgi:hypothetical protein
MSFDGINFKNKPRNNHLLERNRSHQSAAPTELSRVPQINERNTDNALNLARKNIAQYFLKGVGELNNTNLIIEDLGEKIKITLTTDYNTEGSAVVLDVLQHISPANDVHTLDGQSFLILPKEEFFEYANSLAI